MQKPTITAIAAALVFVSPGIASAAVPHVFEAGNPARAAEVNENFGNLDQRVIQLETGDAEWNYVEVDCDADPDALKQDDMRSNTAYTLTGMCNGPIYLENLRNVVIEGDINGIKDDGIVLPAGLNSHPWAAIGIWNTKGVEISNLTISAENYVSGSYSFGDNVASLTAGDQSFVEVTQVDLLGGDYSADIYNGSQLRIQNDVQVLGFNKTGLAAYNHALIRTHDFITVAGIDGASTEVYTYAFSAVNNSIVEIRDGGDFSGASGQPVDEYPNAVWAGDNSTIRIRNGNNPASISGSIESAYSSMIRIDGNTVLDGALASYHRGYIRATGLTQSGGEIYSGDASTIRFEGGSIAPSSVTYPDSPFDIYRQGNVRMNNTTVNMNGNPVYVGGFGVLNLRGSTNFGGADIECSFDRADVSIRNTVTNVGLVCGSPAP